MNKKIIISKLEEVLKARLIIGNEEIRVLSLTDSLVKLKKNNVGFFFLSDLYYWFRSIEISDEGFVVFFTNSSKVGVWCWAGTSWSCIWVGRAGGPCQHILRLHQHCGGSVGLCCSASCWVCFPGSWTHKLLNWNLCSQ